MAGINNQDRWKDRIVTNPEILAVYCECCSEVTQRVW